MNIGIRLGAACLVAVVCLAGCGGGAETQSNATVTAVFPADWKDAFEGVVDAFETKHPDVKVKASYVGGDIAAVLLTQIQAGTAPDIIVNFPGDGGPMTVGTQARQGNLLDLSDSPWASSIPPLWKGEMGLDGKTFAYPGAMQGLGAVYNKTLLDQLGLSVPTTYDQVLALCQAAKGKGKYAYAQALNDPAGPQMIYHALSATLVYGPDPEFTKRQTEKKATFADSPWRDVFAKYVQMHKEGCFGEGVAGRTRQQGSDVVAKGDALAVVDVGAVLATVEKAAPNNEYLMAPLPATNNPEETFMPALPGFVISVNAKTKNPSGSRAFLDVLAEPAVINAYASAFSSVPVIPNSEFKAPAVLSVLDEAIKSGTYSKLPKEPGSLQQVAQQEVQSVLLGRDSIDTALRKMQDAFDAG